MLGCVLETSPSLLFCQSLGSNSILSNKDRVSSLVSTELCMLSFFQNTLCLMFLSVALSSYSWASFRNSCIPCYFVDLQTGHVEDSAGHIEWLFPLFSLLPCFSWTSSGFPFQVCSEASCQRLVGFPPWSRSGIDRLCKGPDGNCFRFCGPHKFSVPYSSSWLLPFVFHLFYDPWKM